MHCILTFIIGIQVKVFIYYVQTIYNYWYLSSVSNIQMFE